MGHIFISYCHQDGRFARILHDQLEEAQFSTWRDPNLRPGESWRDEIDDAIRDAAALIAIMSPEAKASPYVNYEWAFALGTGVKVVPVLLGLPPEQLHPRLSALQALDFTDPLARPWSELFAALGRIADSRRPAPARGWRGAPDVVRQAAAGLDSLNSSERSAALETLKQMNHPAAVEVLAVALGHPVREVRLGAAYALSEFRDARAVPELLETAREPQAGDPYHLARIGSAAVPQLLHALGHPDAGVRSMAAAALGQIGDTRALPALADLLEDPQDDVRHVALIALGAFGRQAPVAAMAARLRDASDRVRLAAATALGEVGGAEAAAALAPALQDPDREVRNMVVCALGKTRDSAAVPALVEALCQDAYDQARNNAARALGVIGDAAAVPALLQAARGESGIVRARSFEALVAIANAEVLAGLAALLDDADARVRRDAAGALERIGTAEARAALQAAQVRRGQSA